MTTSSTDAHSAGAVRGCTWLGLLLLNLLGALAVHAHDPGLSALTLRTPPNELLVTLSLARSDAETLIQLDRDRDGKTSPAEFAQARPALEQLATDRLKIALGGQVARPSRVTASLEPAEAVQITLHLACPAGAKLRIDSDLLTLLPRGHRQYLTLQDESDRVLASAMLDAANTHFETSLEGGAPASPTPGGPREFLGMGIEHIATGYDHLAFLFGLLIVGASFRSVLKIITSFTVAHSVTLALATLNLIRLPSALVEPAIAISILYVGIENLVRRDLERRWRLAFVFGLIHGCGFASALREVGVGSGSASVVMPLLCFNVGVELGQLALAAVVLPGLWALRRRSALPPRLVPACSILIALAGAYWFADRVFANFGR